MNIRHTRERGEGEFYDCRYGFTTSDRAERNVGDTPLNDSHQLVLVLFT